MNLPSMFCIDVPWEHLNERWQFKIEGWTRGDDRLLEVVKTVGLRDRPEGVRALARRLGVGHQTVGRWRDEFQEWFRDQLMGEAHLEGLTLLEVARQALNPAVLDCLDEDDLG